jgi:hypothetical protein
VHPGTSGHRKILNENPNPQNRLERGGAPGSDQLSALRTFADKLTFSKTAILFQSLQSLHPGLGAQHALHTGSDIRAEVNHDV